ncbi:hypothetical protein TRVA0_007S01970 [Trichomonascus vanleenenianus]|uniref:alpha/beta hydrolase n=1 Tax=Trichomonascus vanleenenianus TaxID=2268995 RepID=UPI003EC9D9CC
MTADTQIPQPPYAVHKSVEARLDPEYIEFFNKNLATSKGTNLLYTHIVPLDKVRAGGNVMPGQSPLLPMAKTYDIAIPRDVTAKDAPTVAARVFVPQGEAPEGGWPCTVWFHGGGWVLGNITTENSFCTHVAEWSRCIVVSVDYRLAPEDVFPAAIDDSYEALLYVMKHAGELNVNPAKVAVAGSSAGGNISAVLTHKYASDESHSYPPLVFQLLVVPVCDNTADVDTHLSYKEFEHVPQLPRDKMVWYRNLYLPNKADWTNPEASPIFYPAESFKNVPKAMVCCGECDVLRTEGEQYAEKLKAAGIDTNLVIYPGMPHPVMAMDDCLTQGKRLVKEACDALRTAFY